MSVIASKLAKHRIEVAWGAFAVANLVVMPYLRDWETVPFHLVWVSLTLVYGFRLWKLKSLLSVLSVIVVVTAAELIWMTERGQVTAAELTEVPLMSAMLLAMAWHATRRRAA